MFIGSDVAVLLINGKNYLLVVIMFEEIFRVAFLSIVFISGVLIGGIYTPEITTYSKSVDNDTNVDKQDVKPLRKKRQKKQRVV